MENTERDVNNTFTQKDVCDIALLAHLAGVYIGRVCAAVAREHPNYEIRTSISVASKVIADLREILSKKGLIDDPSIQLIFGSYDGAIEDINKYKKEVHSGGKH
jgi:hypothetical protein